MQAAADCQELKVKLVRGFSINASDSASHDDDQARAREWALYIIDLSCHASANIAMTPSMVAKRIRAETVWRYTKYLATTAAVLAGLGIAYQVYNHMSVQAQQQLQPKTSSRGVSEPRSLRSNPLVWNR